MLRNSRCYGNDAQLACGRCAKQNPWHQENDESGESKNSMLAIHDQMLTTGAGFE